MEVGSESGSDLAKFATQEEAWRTEQVLPPARLDRN